MARSLRTLLLSLVLGLPLAARADFTEYEDQPQLTQGGLEVDALNDAEPVPEGGASFLSAFPTGVKLVRGYLDVSDIDAYQVQLTSGQLLLAALFDQGGGAFLDTALGVFTGTTPPAVAIDDDGARGLLSRLHHTATATGLHRIAVSGFGDTAWNGTHQESQRGLRPYYLALGAAVNPPALRDSDLDPGPQGSNDLLSAADLLPENGALLGASLAAGDVDYYAIELEEGDRLFVAVFELKDGAFEPAEGSFHDPVVGLFNTSGTLIVGADDDGHAGFAPGRAFAVGIGAGGLYRFAVSGFGDTDFDGDHGEGPFEYLLLVARDRACPNVVPLISNLTASTANPYAIAELQGGDHYYTDRTNEQSHVLVDIPEELECAEWIQTANNDKSVTTFPHLSFTVSQAASVFIGYDTRLVSEPTWLATGFTPLPAPMLIDIRDSDETQEFRVLRRDFAAGTVQLGGNGSSSSFSNYTVVALPLDTGDPGHAVLVPSPVQTGSASVTVNGVMVSVSTSQGQSASSVAAALAAAANANPTLQGLRVFAIASGDHFVTTGDLQQSTFAPEIPLASPIALAVLAFLLVAGARLYLRAFSR